MISGTTLTKKNVSSIKITKNDIEKEKKQVCFKHGKVTKKHVQPPKAFSQKLRNSKFQTLVNNIYKNFSKANISISNIQLDEDTCIDVDGTNIKDLVSQCGLGVVSNQKDKSLENTEETLYEKDAAENTWRIHNLPLGGEFTRGKQHLSFQQQRVKEFKMKPSLKGKSKQVAPWRSHRVK